MEKSGSGEQLTGRQVEPCAHAFSFFRGGNDCQFRLWLWLQITDRFRGGRATGHSRCILAVPIGSQCGLSIKCDVRKLGFFWFFLFCFLVFFSHRWHRLTDTGNGLGRILRGSSLMCKKQNGRNLRFYFWPGFVIFAQGTIQLYLRSGREIGCVDCGDAPGAERLPHWGHCGRATEV